MGEQRHARKFLREVWVLQVIKQEFIHLKALGAGN
eukprot:gene2-4_t